VLVEVRGCNVIALLQDKTERLGCGQKWDDEFLSLFPHRWDFIYLEHPASGKEPIWKTESGYPLSDRKIQQGEYLYGVRFGPQTNYLLIDVDPTSWYHPEHDAFAIAGITAALEPIGLVSYVPIQSSYRKGIHLYFPFEETQPSWEIALVVQTLLERAGFVMRAGQLEIFPNARTFAEGPLPLYSGHRLPLQAGSYLLDEDWMSVYSTQAAFVARWKRAQGKNVLDLKAIARVRKQAQHQRIRTSNKAQKFLSDLNIEIEPGWTGTGQTNLLLGKIACRERVFHHVLHGGEPLTGETLTAAICQVARSLPGYQEFCNHRDELERRAREYARSAEKRYYPFGSKKRLKEELKVIESGELTWNQRQAQAARDRIREAIADMVNQGILPPGVTARFKALKRYGIGSDALYIHKDLWHPNHLESLQDKEFPPAVPDLPTLEALESLQDKEFPPAVPNKFADPAGSDAPQEQSEASSAFKSGGSGGFSTGDLDEEVGRVSYASPADVCKLVDAIRRHNRSQKLSKLELACGESLDKPPDEKYFRLYQSPRLLRTPDS
jgi:hypothetical protein